MSITMPAAGTNKQAFTIGGNGTVTSAGTLYGALIQPSLGCTSGTLANAYHVYISPLYGQNTQTITSAYCLFIDGGSTAGTISYGTTAYITMPSYGTVQKIGINLTGNATVASGNFLYGFLNGVNLGCNSGTLANVMNTYIQPNFTQNTATIASAYGLYIENGSTAGTITTGYGAYINMPAYGTNKHGLRVVGTTTVKADNTLIAVRLDATLGCSTGVNGYMYHMYMYPDYTANAAAATITNAYGIFIDSGAYNGTITNGTNLYVSMPAYGTTNKIGLKLTGNATTTSAGYIYGLLSDVNLGCTSGTLVNAFSNYFNPQFSQNTQTITSAYGLFVDTGNTAGTVSFGTSVYISMPTYGTTKYGLHVGGAATTTSAGNIYGFLTDAQI